MTTSPLRMIRRSATALLEPDDEITRFAIAPQPELLDQHLGQAAARAFGEQGVFAAQLHAAGKSGFVMAILGEAHVAGGDAGDRAILKQSLGGGETRIDLDAEH